jgi:hypothetical protein
VIGTLVRFGLAAPLLAMGIGAASEAAHVGPTAALCAQAGAPHRVGIVVEHGDGRVVRACVGFASASITAMAVLDASGIQNQTSFYSAGLGSEVCQIDNEPAQYTECLPPSGSYWVLFIARAGGAWAGSARGASSATVTDGDDVGFRYDPEAAPDPPPASPAGTCPPATAPPVPTPVPSTKAPATVAPGARRTPATSPSASLPPSPTGTVLGLSSPAVIEAPSAAVPSAAAVGGSINAGLLTGACCAGALIGLLGVQLARRRRR